MLADRLAHALEHGETDAVLLTADSHDLDLRGGETLLPAAVLVPVTDRAAPGVILTQRTDTLRRHAGQIAFPGGRIDATDAGPIEAALREADEEIGLPPERVQVIGIVPPDFPYVPSAAEVAGVFEVPLDFLLDEANHVEAAVEWQGRERHYYEITWDDRRIWGATAAMIVNLARRLRWA